MLEEKTGPSGAGASQAKVSAAMGFAVVALAFSSIFISQLERSSVPPLVIAFYRMFLATGLLLPAALTLKRREIALLARGDLIMLLLGGLFLAVHFGAWITSLKYIPISTSVVLVNTHPVFVVIASYLFLGEKPSRNSLVGTGIGLAGMIVITGAALGDVRLAMKGNALAILGALAVVGYFVIGRKARGRLSLVGYVTPLYLVCSVFLLLWVLAAGEPLWPYKATHWGYFAALAVIPTILGHTVFNWAIKHVRPSAISVAFLGEPVAASILAFLFFSQRPPLSTYLGGVLILAGVYLSMSSQPEASQ